ncbi:MAG TPA: site-specific integrase, partial [Ferruginibacter sp.]|nr:site-specific integrase [Ferruginibacter sp.]
MFKSPSTSIYIDRYHPKSDGKCAVSLRVTYNRNKRYYPTKYKLTPDEFSKMFTPKPRDPFKTYLAVLAAEERKATDIIEDLKDGFTWALFEKRFVRKTGDSENLFALMEERAKELKEEGRIGTGISFECALSSLKGFYTKPILTLDELNVPFLQGYKKWMGSNGKSNATIGIYLRNVRYIFNKGIADGVVPKEIYPFGSGTDKFTIPTGRNIKKALPLSEVSEIINYMAKTDSQAKAKDFWLFSFYASGINIKDIALLKFKNIVDDIINFERAKTKRANEDKPIIIRFAITPEVKRIISKWGNKSINPNDYIFPILRNNITPEQEYKLIQLFTRFMNNHMDDIRKDLGISTKVTTYVCRHTASTILRNNNVTVEEIS